MQQCWGGQTAAGAAAASPAAPPAGSRVQQQQLLEQYEELEIEEEDFMEAAGYDWGHEEGASRASMERDWADWVDQQVSAGPHTCALAHTAEAVPDVTSNEEEDADAAALAAMDEGAPLVDCSTTNKDILLDR